MTNYFNVMTQRNRIKMHLITPGHFYLCGNSQMTHFFKKLTLLKQMLNISRRPYIHHILKYNRTICTHAKQAYKIIKMT